MLKRVILTLMIGFTLAFTVTSFAGKSPTDDVRTSVDAILALLKNEQLSHEDKRTQMSSLINERFDFRAMSQRTLATNWKNTTDEEKAKFVELFSKLIENSYVGKIESYTNERVDYPGEKVNGRKAVVETLIITSSADIPVDYRLYQKRRPVAGL